MVDNNKNKIGTPANIGSSKNRPAVPRSNRVIPVVPDIKVHGNNKISKRQSPRIIANKTPIPKIPNNIEINNFVKHPNTSTQNAIRKSFLNAENTVPSKFLRELASREAVSDPDIVMTSQVTTDESYKTTIGSIGSTILNSDKSAIFSTVLATTSITSSGDINSTSGNLTTTGASLGNDGALIAVTGHFAGPVTTNTLSAGTISAGTITGSSLDINGQAQADSLTVLGICTITGALSAADISATGVSADTGTFTNISSIGTSNLNSVVASVSIQSPVITGGDIHGTSAVRGLNITCDNTLTTDRFDAAGSSFANDLTVNDITINNSFYALLLEGQDANIAGTVTCANLNAANIRTNGYVGGGDIGSNSIECTNIATNNISGLTPTSSMSFPEVNVTSDLNANQITVTGFINAASITASGHIQGNLTMDVAGQLSAGSINNVATMDNIGSISVSNGIDAATITLSTNITSPAATIGAIGCTDITAADQITGDSLTIASVEASGNIHGSTIVSDGNISTTSGNVSTTNGDIISTNGNVTAVNGNIIADNGSVSSSTLAISTDADITNNLDVHNDVHVYNNLTVDGQIAIDDLTVDNLNAVLNITSQTGNIVADQGNINVTLGDINALAGTVTARSVTAGTGGIATIGSVSSSTLAISTDADITNNLDVHNDVHVYNDLTVDGSLIFDNNLTVNSLYATTSVTASEIKVGSDGISTIAGIPLKVNNNIMSSGYIISTGSVNSSGGNISATVGDIIATVGDIIATVGDVIISAGNLNVVSGNISAPSGSLTIDSIGASGTITSQLGLTAAGGDITATLGNISATVGDIIISAGNLNVVSGNISAPSGSLTIDSIGASGNISADNIGVSNTIEATSNITSSTGDIISTSGSVVGDSFSGYTHSNKYITMDTNELSIVSNNNIDLWSGAGKSFSIDATGDIATPLASVACTIHPLNWSLYDGNPWERMPVGTAMYDPQSLINGDVITIKNEGIYKVELSLTLRTYMAGAHVLFLNLNRNNPTSQLREGYTQSFPMSEAATTKTTVSTILYNGILTPGEFFDVYHKFSSAAGPGDYVEVIALAAILAITRVA